MNTVSSVVRPQLPYWGPISGGLFLGKLIEIEGSVPYGGEVFEINLVTGSDPASDRAFHLSVRFHDRVAVRNSMQYNAWGDEERGGPFPFVSGRDFKMMILPEQNSYRIAVDGVHAYEFMYRIPLSRVNMIFISGSVKINRIEFRQPSTLNQIGTCLPPPRVGIVDPYPVTGHIYPHQIGTCIQPPRVGIVDPYPVTGHIYPLPGQVAGGCHIPGAIITPGIGPTICPPSLPGQNIGTCMPPLPGQPGDGYFPSGNVQISSNLAPVYNPEIPYAYPIYGGLRPGMMIYISGRPSVSAYKFTLNLQCGTSPYPPPDIAFHFDVRFFNNTTIRNNRTNDTWGQEEFHARGFPFQQGVNFDLMIRVENDRYMVALNGQHFVEFKHRMFPLSRIDTLYIENDIVVSSIRFA